MRPRDARVPRPFASPHHRISDPAHALLRARPLHRLLERGGRRDPLGRGREGRDRGAVGVPRRAARSGGADRRSLMDRVAFSQHAPLRLVRCRECGLVYRNPVERATELDAIYARGRPGRRRPAHAPRHAAPRLRRAGRRASPRSSDDAAAGSRSGATSAPSSPRRATPAGSSPASTSMPRPTRSPARSASRSHDGTHRVARRRAPRRRRRDLELPRPALRSRRRRARRARASLRRRHARDARPERRLLRRVPSAAARPRSPPSRASGWRRTTCSAFPIATASPRRRSSGSSSGTGCAWSTSSATCSSRSPTSGRSAGPRSRSDSSSASSPPARASRPATSRSRPGSRCTRVQVRRRGCAVDESPRRRSSDRTSRIPSRIASACRAARRARACSGPMST